jgi:hypothetical protein
VTGYASAFDTYHSRGWPVLPIPKGKKRPPPEGFTGHNGITPSYPDMLAWSEDQPDGNVCIRLPRGVIGIDVDDYEDKNGGDTLAEAENRWGKLPPSYRSTSRDDGVSGIRLYLIPEGVELAEGIEFRELPRQLVYRVTSYEHEHTDQRWMSINASARWRGSSFNPPGAGSFPSGVRGSAGPLSQRGTDKSQSRVNSARAIPMGG